MQERLNYNGTRRLPEILSEDEINTLLKTIKNSKKYLNNDWGRFMRWRDMTIVATIYLLALRPKEALKLKFSDFNLKRAYVKIRGKNNKTGKDRIIPVPKELLKFYKIYFQFPRNRFWKGSKYLFPSFQNTYLSTERWKHIFREKVLKPAKLWRMPEDHKVPEIRTYTLRHSRATHIRNNQIKKNGFCDPFLIANLLGHSDLRSSQVYLHQDEEYLEYMRDEI